MDQKLCSNLRPREEKENNQEFNLREWDLKASRITRQTTNSRRFSASNITGLKDDNCRSFRSNNNNNINVVSSTASSPGYPLKEEINPSTYSFSTALKALQPKSLRSNWDCLSPEGLALNSKWNDAEKYICNPLSGQVPLECLSARSFRSTKNRIAISAPLTYCTKTRTAQPKPSLAARKSLFQIPIEGKKEVGMSTRDVGIQSTEAEINEPGSSSSSSSSGLSSTKTPSIGERMSKRLGTESGESESPNSSSKPKSEEEVEVIKTGRGDQEGGERGKEELCKEEHNIVLIDKEGSPCHDDDDQEVEQIHRSGKSANGGGCLSWMRSRRVHQQKRSDKALQQHKIGKKRFFNISCTTRRSYA